MTDDTTLGVGTARSWARVATLSVDAGHVAGTLAVTHALGTTLRWLTGVIGQTGARGQVVDHTTLCIWTATLAGVHLDVLSFNLQ